MTTDTNKLVLARKTFLDALNDPQADTTLLQDMAQTLKAGSPDIFVAYAAGDNLDPIATTQEKWNEQYFSQQKKLAERNFSLDRIEHLIQVRDRFRRDGRKGFVARPQPAFSRDSGASAAYTPSRNLRKFVEEGDLTTVRTALTVELEDDRTDACELRAALAWAKARVPGLCEPYSEKGFARAIEHDRQQWTTEYYNKQMVYLDTNFAEERFLHLIELRDHLNQKDAGKPVPPARPAPAAAPRPAPPSAGAHARPRQQASRPAPPPGRGGLSSTMLAALLVGGALAALVVLILALRK
jgi:hypothetical protein